MIALDTNVLVRYLVQDDPKQSGEATRLIERAVEREESLYLSQIVVCELVWVLSYAYGFPRKEIAAVLDTLRRAAQLEIEGAESVRRAIDDYSSGRGDFADFLIAEHALARGCSHVATFDRTLHSDRRFMPVTR